MINKNNKKIIILLVFVISVLTLTSFFTVSRFAYKKTLTGSINSTIIKIEFEPNGDNEYKLSQSTTVSVTHKASTEFSVLKYVWATSEMDASDGLDFTNFSEISKSTNEGEYHLCIYAEDINGLHNNVCSDAFFVDNKAPKMLITNSLVNGNYYIVVNVEENGSGIKSVTSNEGLTLDHVDGDNYYFLVTSDAVFSFTATDNLDNATTKSYDLCHEIEETVTNFPYTGGVQSFSPVCSGLYQIEAWGAEGGTDTYDANAVGQGKGAYTRGNIGLTSGDTLYVYVGERGTAKEYSQLTLQYTFNGGGYANVRPTDTAGGHLASGGGASDIRITGGTWDNANSLRSRIMVAAGGAGGFYAGSEPGAGGGLKGYDGVKSTTNWWSTLNAGFGANQTEPGALSGENYLIIGGFGYGGTSSGGSWGGGAGGSGWYGGSGGYVQSGGGGSSYISGHTGCVGVTSTSSSSPKSGCTTGTTNRSCSLSPYEKEFTNTIMIDGKGCKWTNAITSECSGQPQPDGTTSLGHSGNGYVRIKFLSKQYTLSYDYEGCTSKNIYNGQKYGTLCSPTRSGYAFDGWYLGDTEITENSIVNTDSNIELSAHWRKYIIITLDNNVNYIPNGDFTNGTTGWVAKNGGTISIDNTVLTPSNKPSLKVCGSNIWAGFWRTDLTPALGKKMIFSFKAYRNTELDSSFNGGINLHYGSGDTQYNPGVNFFNGTPINTWGELSVRMDIPSSINDFMVYGNFNRSLSSTNCVWVTDLRLTEIQEMSRLEGSTIGMMPIPTRSGYVFEGYYTESVGGTKIDESTPVPENNTTYYAHWRSPKITSLDSWQRPSGNNTSTTTFTIGSSTYTSNSENIIGGSYWYGNSYSNINVLGGTNVYMTSGYGASTRWYSANSEDAYICTGSRLIGTMPDKDVSLFVYPDVGGHNDAKRRVITGLTNLRCG